MTGVLLVDKPVGPTSHDVVQRVRKILKERSIGHTGTLDPLASGLLPLVIGRATRLAPLFSGSDKTYEATVRLGFCTDTDDAAGTPIEGSRGRPPADDVLKDALDGFLGPSLQTPPQYSAKRVHGEKAYRLARQQAVAVLQPVEVTLKALEWLGRSGDQVRLRMTVTAGFYVRALARDLGTRVGCGGHLTALRRISVGSFSIDDAVSIEDCERAGPAVSERLISPVNALPHLPAVRLNDAGLRRALHGNTLDSGHFEAVEPSELATSPAEMVRLLSPDGDLVALGRKRGTALHPVVVLG
jgi:tRNA pseudouridine55 synthase